MKKKLCFLFAVFALVLLLPSQFTKQAFCALAYAEVSTDSISLDSIDESSVIVTLTTDATKAGKLYSVNDFSKIGCVEIDDLTEYTSDYVKEQTRGVLTNKSMLVKTDNYKRILKLTLKKSGADNIAQAIKALNNRNDVFTARPNYIYSVNSIPNDEYVVGSGTWGLVGKNGIQAESAWNVSTGSNAVTVGIMDTGIEGSHPDLVNRISTEGLHRDFTVTPDVAVPNGSLFDPNGHGTHVAGIVGAQGNNSTGISGVCWDIRLVSLRVFDKDGYCSSTSIARAINFAASQNIPILNYSGDLKGNDENVKIAIDNYSGLFVCSAGNDNNNNDYYPAYPSSYDLPNIISVGSIDSDGFKSSFSNYGKISVDIFAPGGNILSTYPHSICPGEIFTSASGVEFRECEYSWNEIDGQPDMFEFTHKATEHRSNGYHYMSGTSMAAPFVTGVAALLLTNNPGMSAFDLKYTIMQNVDESSELSNYCVSGGRLNAYKALSNPHVNHSYGIDYEFIDNAAHRETCLCGVVTIKPHNYTAFRYVDGRYHKAICNCGQTVTDMHVVKEGASIIKKCLLCHRQVDTGITIFPNTLSILPATDNGSYILPNGIIVLVEDDVEAYFNGTLVFNVYRNQVFGVL